MSAPKPDLRGDLIPIRVDRLLATVSVPADLAVPARRLLADLIRSDGGPVGARIALTGSKDFVRVTVDGRRWDPGERPAWPDQLLYVLLRLTLDRDPARLHLHAGFVALGAQGLLIAGWPGSGKSTLIAHLIADGFGYLTDERVAVDEQLHVTAVQKPVSLIPASSGPLTRFDPRGTGHGVATPHSWYLPASAIREGSTLERAEVEGIVFVRFRADSDPGIRHLHPAEAARLLLADSPDSGRFGTAALPLVARLCARVPSVEVTFADTAFALAEIRGLAADVAPHPRVDVVELARPRRTRHHAPLSADSVLSPAPGISGVCIEDRCLVRRGPTEDIMELDDHLSAWLQLFDGRSSVTTIIDELVTHHGLGREDATAATFGAIEQLITHGLVA